MNKSDIFKTAWSYFKTNLFISFSDALKAAWAFHKTVKLMKQGKVEITFRKANGEITSRLGTLSRDLIDYTTKGGKSFSKVGTVRFYSLTDQQFRAFRIERLLSYKSA